MLVGGLRALFLQALHPAAMAGVDQNSSFRQDAWGRLTRTTEYVSRTTFGTTDEAAALGARVRKVHASLGGVDPTTGRRFRVDDQDLLLWVHVALVDSFLDVGRRAGARLGPGDADRYVAEQVRAAELVGLAPDVVPRTAAELAEHLRSVRPRLAVTEAARSATFTLLVPPMPLRVELGTPARPAWTLVASLGAASLPRWARRLYGLPGLPTTDLATATGLRALRLGLLAVPEQWRQGPAQREARARLDPAA